MDPGDYYDESGNRLGTDGNNDSKFYLVTNDQTAKQIKKTDKQKGTTDVSSLSSSDYIQMPAEAVRDAVGAEVQRSNKPDTDVRKAASMRKVLDTGRTLQVSWLWCLRLLAQLRILKTDSHASIDTSVPANSADAGRIVTLEGSSHVHPKGEIVVGPPSSGGTGTTIGGTTTTYNFNQPPSSVDLGNAKAGMLNIVVGARDKTVYFYNDKGNVGHFPLDKFLKLGKK
jgi:hypothetical protein